MVGEADCYHIHELQVAALAFESVVTAGSCGTGRSWVGLSPASWCRRGFIRFRKENESRILFSHLSVCRAGGLRCLSNRHTCLLLPQS